MIGYIKGKVLLLTHETALIETASGIGFEVLLSDTAFHQLQGQIEGGVYTYMRVKEDEVSLYGFSTTEEKQMFLNLTSVSGVGPKIGIGLLSALNVVDIATAIGTGDVKKLASVKGMGKKTAERIILELKEKVSMAQINVGDSPSVPKVEVSASDEDAVVALMTLGFSRTESVKAISRSKEQGAKTLEDIIMLALKGM